VRILCVCDEGNSRSPTIASLLRYRDHETLSVGAGTSTDETRRMLTEWCDLAIFTNIQQQAAFPDLPDGRARVWPIADAYPRPFNSDLRKIVLDYAAREGL
jgi:hypothetical protein